MNNIIYDLTIMSILRQSEGYLSTYLSQVEQAFYLNGGCCRAIWVEGDSTDNTYKILQEAKSRIESNGHIVTLVKFDTGAPYWESISNQDRWMQLSTCWNKCLEQMEPSRITVCVESDLKWQPSIIQLLASKLDDDHNVIYPMLMTENSLGDTPAEWFHDTNGFHRGGQDFKNLPPYWCHDPNLVDEPQLLQITTGGGMIVSSYEYQKLGKFDTSCCVMKYPENIKLFMDKSVKIYHPKTAGLKGIYKTLYPFGWEPS